MKTEQQLPKNIRQIGSPAGHTKVYIEDYVITFLNSLSMDKNTYVRGAILFGEKKQIGNDLHQLFRIIVNLHHRGRMGVIQ